MKHFMLDIEAMGLDPMSDDILELAILEVNEVNGFYKPGKVYSRRFFTSQKPKDEWIETHHRDLIRSCRKIPVVSPKIVRDEILEFFKSCGQVGPAKLLGLNLMSYDIPFLIQKGFLKKEDFHYRVYEMRGLLNGACMALSMDEKSLYETAEATYPQMELPEGKSHQALFDCFKQLKVLNGLILLLRNDQMPGL